MCVAIVVAAAAGVPGESVSWGLRLTVAPTGSSGSPPMRLGRALVTGIVGLAAIAVGLVLVRRRRL